MATKRDFYTVLGITREATTVEIEKAFKRLAREHHPDRNIGDPEAEVRFKEVSEAYEVLRDTDKRARYDRYGHAGLEGGDSYGPAGANLNDLFGDILGSFFGGGGRQRSGPRPGRDLQELVDLTLEEAYTGVKRSVTVKRAEFCKTCDGTGAKPGSKRVNCQRCGGKGAVLIQQGFFQVQQTCRACDGRGTIVSDPCTGCRGNGKVVADRTLDVDIPPGVETGNRIRLRGEGEVGDPGAGRGDLELVLRVADHPDFIRDGQNLVTEVPITFSQAALGAEIEIPTLTSKMTLTIPKGIQSHQVLRITGLGMPNVRGGRKGDLLVQVKIETPQTLTKRQEELLRELAEIEHANVSPARESFLQRLKNFFIPNESTPEKPSDS
ncbi:molecular chaperone DnaJ [Tuwongella immobilis]|uniref:Chaperone protein DnaJ n=1 Tax=Tuwongella immobilis TaxID=692036 RepID=A0A6C2YQW1_9BACT|nr:molecular chaperone DnaJ [Tuwongella immobilis]VIP03272.1 chaperone protein : Chaperone protein DnaJ OS=Isosphaera pallida (strain ATCC 43644 / DSM 9630 / IS1B) GN=dnaJ PE=3 SV=1: DnaJ: DnaJ_CXXCXGXG: CTDII [Tuwongella immobilis]VTS03904.1 chaperone protein : Chaperone protein DnaJ OS=Isosphaera pallida (strain ATCC 43644 / DSM 9630 / IS1B) GN=dnaJ PE=3 SV=1: DnaJ: DnaJ_CXXCXGXG: CTDII [Tuwongella immobilis]